MGFGLRYLVLWNGCVCGVCLECWLVCVGRGRMFGISGFVFGILWLLGLWLIVMVLG